MKYRVSYCLTLSNGSIDVEAGSVQEAEDKVENMERQVLCDGCEESYVEVEEICRIEKEKAAS